MTAVLAVLYISAIILVGAFLFVAVDWLEPNRRLAIVFKCAILAAGGAATRSICSLEKALEDGDGYGSFDILQNIWSRRVAGLDA